MENEAMIAANEAENTDKICWNSSEKNVQVLLIPFHKYYILRCLKIAVWHGEINCKFPEASRWATAIVIPFF